MGRLGTVSLGADFDRIWFAQAVSLTGDQISHVAFPALAVLTLEASPSEVALIVAAGGIGVPLFGLVAGVVADRRPRRPIMVCADLVRALALASLPAAALLDVLSLAQMLLVALVLGSANAFFEVATRAWVPTVVGDPKVLGGNLRLEMSDGAIRTAGPGLGGLLVAAVGAAGAIVVDACSFAVSAASLGRVGHREARRVRRGGGLRTALADVREGASVQLRHPVLGPLLGCVTMLNLGAGAMLAILPTLALDELDLSPAVFGLVLTAGGAAALVGAQLGARGAHRFGVGRTVLAATVACAAGVALLPLALTGLPVLWLAASVVVETAAGRAYTVNSVTLRQRLVSDELRGRVFATSMVVAWGAAPVGALLAAAGLSALTDPLGVRGAMAAILLVSAGVLLSGAAFLLRPGVRTLAPPPAPEPPVSAGAPAPGS